MTFDSASCQVPLSFVFSGFCGLHEALSVVCSVFKTSSYVLNARFFRKYHEKRARLCFLVRIHVQPTIAESIVEHEKKGNSEAGQQVPKHKFGDQIQYV